MTTETAMTTAMKDMTTTEDTTVILLMDTTDIPHTVTVLTVTVLTAIQLKEYGYRDVLKEYGYRQDMNTSADHAGWLSEYASAKDTTTLFKQLDTIPTDKSEQPVRFNAVTIPV